MIYGIGVDITELKQIQKLFQKFGNKFVDRILTSEEKKIFTLLVR
ncbi:hypothetical protein KIMC2_07990 [Xylocopilactobacillus apis]|uniref:PAC domain-containing protein n=1 Tax=Xylocopilactobacillus apis TaxID=2932183 RepID=A0AAU9D620_9LACO|nr:4'-phosphopantetheinyl transferase superfamily protein [Xylocopilactobacillus apis]BDR56237.1 hypothetical protein KIMC2_07990 [Xylocopilactobacillus apis]